MTITSDDNRDVRRLAKVLIARYGVQAFSFASHEALKARERGEERLMAGWRWLAATIEEMLREEPDEPGADQSPSPTRGAGA
jgi:hypothetical protein